MSYTLLKPQIDDIDINPNPVDQNKPYLIQVSVSEIEVELEPIVIYCGEIYCGEEAI